MYFALPQNPIAIFYLEDRYYFLTSNKSLMVSHLDLTKQKTDYPSHYIPHEAYKGATILFENISIKGGGVYGLGKNNDGNFVLFYYFINQSELCYLNLNTKAFAKAVFKSDFANHQFKIFNDEQQFYLINSNSNEIWTLTYENEMIKFNFLDFSGVKVEQSRVYFDSHIRKFSFHGTGTIKSFNSVIINEENNFQVNIHKLSKGYNDVFILYIDRHAKPKVTAVRNRDKFEFPDGSEVLLDKRGMLTLVSSNPDLPKIYLPPVQQIALAMATDEEFAGNPYFYDSNQILKVIEIAEFREKYLDRFIQQIIHYEV